MKSSEGKGIKREIKFRAWDSENKRFVDKQFVIDNVGNIFFEYIGGGVTKNTFILLQYTGLKDKKGKEIYEGDIVKDKNTIYWVKYEDFRFLLMRESYYGRFTESIDFKPTKEVIGNIYENPELLINHPTHHKL